MSHALSQWVMAVLLDFLRDGSFYRQNREKREFNKLPQRSTYAMKTAVYGIGAIGSVVANKLGNFFWKLGDIKIINGSIHSLGLLIVPYFVAIASRLQSGFVFHYAFVMIIGFTAILSFFVLSFYSL